MSESGSKENTGTVETIRSTLEKKESQVPWLPASHPLYSTGYARGLHYKIPSSAKATDSSGSQQAPKPIISPIITPPSKKE
jgi:hypothetical protein